MRVVKKMQCFADGEEEDRWNHVPGGLVRLGMFSACLSLYQGRQVNDEQSYDKSRDKIKWGPDSKAMNGVARRKWCICKHI